MRPLLSSFALLLLSACSAKWTAVDVDGDGFTLADGDCWDNEEGPFEGLSSADINPTAVETWYDGFDQDCDGLSDFDKDGDGHASIANPDPGGELPSDDCWDDPDVLPGAFEADDPADQLDASAVYTGAIETWYDGIDQDCAGDDDFDQDGDGFASAAHPDGGTTGDDCFDGPEDDFENGAGLEPFEVNPDAVDTWYDGTDADCGGNDDFDQDEDGFPRDLECDDLDPERFPDPGIPEIWYDGLDDNCDGNDGDQDGDGYYVDGYAFEIPVAFEPGDCWDDPALAPLWSPLNGFPAFDADAAHPGAADTFYDGLDQDCAGDDDFDQDLDGYRTETYADAGGLPGDDCDDLVATTNPGATEVWYDGDDADCAGDDDFDQDHDGHATDTDCDDVEPAVHPGALEACGNTVDEDCSGSTNDEGAFGCTPFHADGDGDSYGSDESACLCEAEGAYTETEGGDCDDGDAAVNPGGTESCSTAVDDDCDGSTNSVGADGCVDWYVDADGDTFGTGASRCQCEAAGTYTADNGDDCNDAVAAVNPDGTETCNDRDDDCDGAADDGLPLYYTDADGDSYGAGTGDCTATGRVANADDCNDASDMVYPGATEYCDGMANDCDTEASWSEADEDQMVSFESTTGAWSDVSAAFNVATAAGVFAESGTYYFCAGTYYTKFVTSGDTTDVIGVYGAAETTLDNNTTTGSTVSVTNGSVTVSGLTITGGHGNTRGGGIVGNHTGTSALAAPHLVVEDCVISGNTATDGGGVAAMNNGWVHLVRTTVTGNTATNGGGIATYLGADLTLEDSIVQGNSASADGGGIYLDDGTLTMTGSSVIDNTAADDGGGIWIDTATASCADGAIYGNDAAASSHGGGVYLATHNTLVASFTSDACNFGTGATDNSPNDVEIKTSGSTYTAYSAYTSAASFLCTTLADVCI